jgi:nucleoid DNA-binding protein
MAKKAAPKAAEPKPAPTPAPAKKAEKAAAPKPKPATKSEIFAALAEKTKLSKKEIAGVFEAMSELIAKDLGKKGPGIFVVPGLLKLKIVDKPATKARPSINPFTKEPMMTKAKPARKAVKAILLKSLKELV